MLMNRLGAGFFVVAVAAVVAGCPPATDGNAIPQSLLDIEGIAEDAYDKALLADFAAVSKDGEDIAAAWDGFRVQAEADGASAETLGGMTASVDGLRNAPEDAVGAGRAANAVSAFMKDLFGLYDPTTPPSIIQLDYGGREIVLDALAADLLAAGVDIDALETEWLSVSDAVVAAGGQDVADSYDLHIAEMRARVTADDADTLIEEANLGLELVDDMEKLYE